MSKIASKADSKNSKNSKSKTVVSKRSKHMSPVDSSRDSVKYKADYTEDESDSVRDDRVMPMRTGDTGRRSPAISDMTKARFQLPSAHPQDVRRSISAAPRSRVTEPSSSTGASKQQAASISASKVASDSANNMKCDKLILDVFPDASELEDAVERAEQLVRDKLLVKVTRKSRFYRYSFKLKFGTGAVAVFSMVPILSSAKTPMQFIFNPNPSHMSSSDAALLLQIWKQLFVLRAKAVAKTMRFRRVDVCADFPHDLDDLIVDMDSTQVGMKYGIKTKRGGKLQSVYMGGVESAHHGLAYDLSASDKYKASVGEVTSRRSLKQDADFSAEGKQGGLRIESRRVFQPTITFAQLGEINDVFEKYKVYRVKRRPGVTLSIEFMAYLDSVRLRGLNGARRWLVESATDQKAALVQIVVFEKQLARMLAPWWRPNEFHASLATVLRTSAAWRFLSVLEMP